MRPQPLSGVAGDPFLEPAREVILFGPYRLDQASGRLLRGDTNVPLRLKTFAVLQHLATRPGRLVAKEELLDAVWPGTHVSPSVLTGCIREIRRALGDDARGARFVETAHRRGYRFIAPPVPYAALVEVAARVLLLTRDSELAAPARRFAEAVDAVVGRRERARTSPASVGPEALEQRHVPPAWRRKGGRLKEP